MVSYLIMVSWIAGVLVPAIVLVFLAKSTDWSKKLAAPTWDFGKSWASNLTAAGTILSYATLLSVFGPTATFHFLSRQAYLSIGIIAGGLVVLAPLAFNVLSRIMRARSQRADSCAFLVSAGITVWGLTLQLFLGACLVWELSVSHILPAFLAGSVIVLVLLFAGGIVIYAALTASDTLERDGPMLRMEVAARQEVEATSPQPKAWTLL